MTFHPIGRKKTKHRLKTSWMDGIHDVMRESLERQRKLEIEDIYSMAQRPLESFEGFFI